MWRHIATLNEENICNSTWSGDWPDGKELADNEIDVTATPGVLGKRYVNGVWEDVPQPEPEPTEEELAQAEMLLMQVETLQNQEAQDEVLAEILLNQMEV